jgi:hypothetical protein
MVDTQGQPTLRICCVPRLPMHLPLQENESGNAQIVEVFNAFDIYVRKEGARTVLPFQSLVNNVKKRLHFGGAYQAVEPNMKNYP